MREELEALKTLEVYGIASCVSVEEKNQARLTIETALKEYETLKTLHANQVETINALMEEDKTKEKKFKVLEVIKELLHLKVIQLLPNDSDTRLFVECGSFKASMLIPPQYIELLKGELL